jgi:FdhE protein
VRDGETALREIVRSMEKAKPEVVMFVVFNALKGLFLEAAERLGGVNIEQWNQGRCPVCGGEPTVAYMIGEGGKRFLVCHRCETHWRFRRLVCPFCEHESPGESSYLFMEAPEYKVLTGYLCGQCRNYIKTWRVEDEDLGKLHPEVEDLKTPGFDGILEDEDYRRGGPNVFGLWIGTVTVGEEEVDEE